MMKPKTPRLTFQGADQWIEWIDGMWVLHCPEWEVPLITTEMLSTMTLQLPQEITEHAS